jgi:hypothetical protein
LNPPRPQITWAKYAPAALKAAPRGLFFAPVANAPPTPPCEDWNVTTPEPDKLFKLLDSIGELLEAHDPLGHGTASHDDARRPAPAAQASASAVSSQAEPEQPRRLADMRLLMCRASAELREYAAEHGCHVRLQLPANPLLVRATASHLEIALVNLLRNSIDAHATTVTLLAELEDNRVEVRVDDDGTPFEADPASELPETPQRWSAHMAGRIARTIAEDHGGQLVLHAYPGRGARACLTLPQADTVDPT